MFTEYLICVCSCVAGLNEVDYSYYPQRAFQLQWLHSYLEAYKEYKGQTSEVTDREVEVLYVQVNQFALVSISPCLVTPFPLPWLPPAKVYAPVAALISRH